MPTYDYLCEKCGHKFEKFQSITAGASRKCPECGKMSLRRLIGAGAGIIFKGSGFYETDYRSKDYQEAAKNEKSAAAKTASSKKADSGGKDKKSETKAKTETTGKKKSA